MPLLVLRLSGIFARQKQPEQKLEKSVTELVSRLSGSLVIEWQPEQKLEKLVDEFP